MRFLKNSIPVLISLNEKKMFTQALYVIYICIINKSKWKQRSNLWLRWIKTAIFICVHVTSFVEEGSKYNTNNIFQKTKRVKKYFLTKCIWLTGQTTDVINICSFCTLYNVSLGLHDIKHFFQAFCETFYSLITFSTRVHFLQICSMNHSISNENKKYNFGVRHPYTYKSYLLKVMLFLGCLRNLNAKPFGILLIEYLFVKTSFIVEIVLWTGLQ